jgi:hypothetical protein
MYLGDCQFNEEENLCILLLIFAVLKVGEFALFQLILIAVDKIPHLLKKFNG